MQTHSRSMMIKYSTNPVEHRRISPYERDPCYSPRSHRHPALPAPLRMTHGSPTHLLPPVSVLARRPPDRNAREPITRASFHGYLHDTRDALVLFEAARRDLVPVMDRRLNEAEKESLIKSGNIFVYNDHTSGIKRWTDSLRWSPSRTSICFLLYRQELDDAPKPLMADLEDEKEGARLAEGLDPKALNALMGSLASTKLKYTGLIKKTVSYKNFHIVAYYTPTDVLRGRLRTPCQVFEWKGVVPAWKLRAIAPDDDAVVPTKDADDKPSFRQSYALPRRGSSPTTRFATDIYSAGIIHDTWDPELRLEAFR